MYPHFQEILLLDRKIIYMAAMPDSLTHRVYSEHFNSCAMNAMQ